MKALWTSLAKVAGCAAVCLLPCLPARADELASWPAGQAGGPASDSTPPVRAKLLADVARIRPGKRFRVGVLLTMQPGWHTYWKNPGDAGLATEITLGLPKGFVAGPMHWPVPKRFTQEGDITGYGYAGEVLHWFDVRPPKELGASGKVTLRADVSYLACRMACVPGEAKLELALPVASDRAAPPQPSESRARFEAWRERLPKAAGARKASPRVSVSSPGSIDRGGARVALTLSWPNAAPARVELFPGPAEGVEVGRPEIRTQDKATHIELPVRGLVGQTRPDRLELLVVATSAGGRREGWSVVAALPSRSKPGPAAHPVGHGPSPRPE